MITTERTYYKQANPDKPFWVLDSPETGGFLALFTMLGGMVGAAIGAVLCCIVDAIWVNGQGMTVGTTAASFPQLAPYFIVPIIIGMVGVFLSWNVLPKKYPPIYFTSRTHQQVHAQFMSLSPTSQTFAQEAYDAVAGFGDVDYTSAEYTLQNDAEIIWNRTYKQLRSRENSGPTELHEERIEAARKALETLK